MISHGKSPVFSDYGFGTVKVSYEKSIASIFWKITFNQNNSGGQIRKAVFYLCIKGTFENDKYDDVVIYVQMPESLSCSSYVKSGSEFIQSTILCRDDGPVQKTVLKKEGENYKTYILGSHDYSENPSEEDIEKGKANRMVCFDDGSLFAKYLNGKNVPDKDYYEMYDSEDHLLVEILHEWKTNTGNDNTIYTQIIPLKYIKLKDGKKIFKSDTDNPYVDENNNNIAIKDVTFNVFNSETGSKESELHPCYVCESSAAYEFTLSDGFTFTGKETAVNAISKLQQMLSECENTELTAHIPSDKTLTEYKNLVTEWKNNLSETE